MTQAYDALLANSHCLENFPVSFLDGAEAPISGANGEAQGDGWNFCGSKDQVAFLRLGLQGSMATLLVQHGQRQRK